MSTVERKGDLILSVGAQCVDHLGAPQPPTNFLVSSEKMIKTSPVFRALLTGGFSETKENFRAIQAREQQVRNQKWTVSLPEDNPDIFFKLLKLIHAPIPNGQTAYLVSPPTLTVKEMSDIITVADKYDMAQMLRPFYWNWWRKNIIQHSTRREATHAAHVALMFGDEDVFASRVILMVLETRLISDGNAMSAIVPFGEDEDYDLTAADDLYWPRDLAETTKDMRLHTLQAILDFVHKQYDVRRRFGLGLGGRSCSVCLGCEKNYGHKRCHVEHKGCDENIKDCLMKAVSTACESSGFTFNIDNNTSYSRGQKLQCEKSPRENKPNQCVSNNKHRFSQRHQLPTTTTLMHSGHYTQGETPDFYYYEQNLPIPDKALDDPQDSLPLPRHAVDLPNDITVLDLVQILFPALQSLPADIATDGISLTHDDGDSTHKDCLPFGPFPSPGPLDCLVDIITEGMKAAAFPSLLQKKELARGRAIPYWKFLIFPRRIPNRPVRIVRDWVAKRLDACAATRTAGDRNKAEAAIMKGVEEDKEKIIDRLVRQKMKEKLLKDWTTEAWDDDDKKRAEDSLRERLRVNGKLHEELVDLRRRASHTKATEIYYNPHPERVRGICH